MRRPRKVAALQGRKVISIATGSLHCVACTDSGEVFTWGDNDEGQLGDGTSEPVTTSKLPTQIPLEFDLLKELSPAILRNRLVLLHHFSDTFCPGLAMFPLGPGLGNADPAGDPLRPVDRLRSLLVSSAKEAAFRKVVQATMLRDRQHGPVIELNRFGVKTKRTKNNSGGNNVGVNKEETSGAKTVFHQMVNKSANLNSESLLLPHRVWKVKFVGESVDDCGGGYSESIAEICDELMQVKYNQQSWT